jgi:uncharacterized protein
MLFASTSIVLLAGFVQGLTGFGFALVAIPLLAAVMPLNQAVPFVVILCLCTNLAVLAECRAFVDVRRIWLLILASSCAAPLGTLLLLHVEANTLRLVAGLLITAFAGLLLSGKSFPIRNDRVALVPVGILSGVLNGSISMSGPPVALFLSNQNAAKGAFRANITFFSLVLNVITILSFVANGLLTAQMTVRVACLIPAILVGVFCGTFMARKTDEQRFKKIALVLIVLSGLWTVLGSVRVP